MAQDGAKIRLYLDAPLAADGVVDLAREQAHYLFVVMRQAAGARLLVFNGTDGEWLAEVAEVGKRGGQLRLVNAEGGGAEARLRLPGGQGG